MALFPPVRQVPDRFTEDTTGEVGLGVQQAEPRLLHDQFQVLGARARVPTDPRLAGLQAFGRRTPQQDGHPADLVLGDLPAAVPGHLRHRQVMMRCELLLAARGFVGPCSAHPYPPEIKVAG